MVTLCSGQAFWVPLFQFALPSNPARGSHPGAEGWAHRGHTCLLSALPLTIAFRGPGQLTAPCRLPAIPQRAHLVAFSSRAIGCLCDQEGGPRPRGSGEAQPQPQESSPLLEATLPGLAEGRPVGGLAPWVGAVHACPEPGCCPQSICCSTWKRPVMRHRWPGSPFVQSHTSGRTCGNPPGPSLSPQLTEE